MVSACLPTYARQSRPRDYEEYDKELYAKKDKAVQMYEWRTQIIL